MANRGNRVQDTPYAFEPAGGASLACTASTDRVALAGNGEQALIANPGSVAVYVEFGSSTVVATTASLCVLPGTQILLTIPENSTHIAGITSSGASTIQISTGWGL